MTRLFASLIRPTFSPAVLRRSLAFGLPRIPHGFALQIMSVGDRFVMTRYLSIAEIGVYSIGVSFGLIEKIVLGAFEYAWAPFYYATAREPDAPRVFSSVATYGIAVLCLMTAGLSAIASDLLDLVTHGQYVAAAGVVTWTAVGVAFYGVYLLTSIGLNITSRTAYYPMTTAVGAAVNIGLNFLFVPRFGIIGAAWANAASYALQAALAYAFSQHFYPVAYEYGRVLRAVSASVLAFGAARALPAMPPAAGVLARGVTVMAVMTAILWLTRFFNPEELRALNALRIRRAARPAPPGAETTELAGEIVAVEVPDPSSTHEIS
jgi:O-antigen/teichoic acid export membrane protein